MERPADALHLAAVPLATFVRPDDPLDAEKGEVTEQALGKETGRHQARAFVVAGQIRIGRTAVAVVLQDDRNVQLLEQIHRVVVPLADDGVGLPRLGPLEDAPLAVFDAPVIGGQPVKEPRTVLARIAHDPPKQVAVEIVRAIDEQQNPDHSVCSLRIGRGFSVRQKTAADRRLETEKRVRQDVEPRPVRPPRVRAAHDHSAVFANLGTSARSARQQEPRPNRKDSFFQFRYSEILNSKTFHPLGTRPKTRRSNQNTNACR